MGDMEARRVINEHAKDIKKLANAIEASAKRQLDAQEAAQADKVKSTLIEVQSKLFDRGAAYTNLIMIGGYASAFGLWSATRPQLPARANVAIALGLGLSLFSFVCFEIYKMTTTAVRFLKNRKLIMSVLPPDKYLANLQKMASEEQKLSMSFIPIWLTTFIISLVTGLGAIGLLFYNQLAVLVGWPAWPR
jgi:hypothetical protein